MHGERVSNQGVLSESMSEYDAFASHATDPDGALVRRVKATLEGFHKRAGVPERYADASGGTPLEPLTVCVWTGWISFFRKQPLTNVNLW